MPYKDPEKKKEYQKEYRKKNKEKIQEQIKEYREQNKEKIKEQNKEYRKKNKEKIKEHQKEYHKEYQQSPAGKKSTRISHWKGHGIISDDYDALYKRFLETTNCELCNCELTVDKRHTSTTRCLDHDHETGEVRNVLCNACNIKRG